MTISSTLSPLWNVPYQRNPFFTGREDILRHLHQTLHAENAVALSHPQGISGLGGIGKTQTALEYAYRYGCKYDAVFWVQADSTSVIISGYVELAHVLSLPERDEQDQNIILEGVLRWLRLHTGWLLVLDGMDDLAVAESFLPKVGQGHVLSTTRAHALGQIAQRLEIQQMEPETGALLLLRRASIIPLHSQLHQAVSEDRSIACEISQELDGLPLALDQAGAYVKETPCSLMDYLSRYRSRHRDLLQVRGKRNLEYPASVATTWSLSFEKVSEANLAAAELLKFCAYLSSDAIPEEILAKGAPYLGITLATVAADPILLDQACKEVLRYSLFQRGSDDQTLTVHRLVQVVLRDNMPIEIQQQWMERAVLGVNASFPSGEHGTWAQCEAFLPHALVCAKWIPALRQKKPEGAQLLNGTGRYLYERAQYGEAEPLLQYALTIRQEQLGASHPETATSLNNLAAVYERQGHFEEAEALLQRALTIREERLGASHPETAINLHNMAELYRMQGRYEEAEPLYRRALTITEERLGTSHPQTAISLNNLALLYQSQGRYKEAELLYLRALSIAEEQLGVSHPQTAISLNNLAELYQIQGRYEEVEPLYRRAVEIALASLSIEHPQTQQIIKNCLTFLSPRYTNGDMAALIQFLAERARRDDG
ncbi:MAG TPA: FxSxx-COOH system tetratricopeptide repeat protein [Ktedonobacteraceae bacterium]|nr:FxSxx-COOH system tetratricopeptide repeat protein [Ktedonobacteraceae bacterium]